MFVPCANHLLNLDMKSYLTDEETVTTMIEQICEVMKQSKTLTNAAVLTRYTNYKSVLPNVTHWSSTELALARFVQVYDALVCTAEDCDSDLIMNEEKGRMTTEILDRYCHLSSTGTKDVARGNPSVFR